MSTIAAPRRPLVAGNWKMNGSRADNAALLAAIAGETGLVTEVAVCPPSCYLADVATALHGSHVAWGAQDVSEHAAGAYTGEVAAEMLAELGCGFAIVGHSERRAMHAEDDALVARKAKAALAAGITPIVCVGETLDERDAGRTEAVAARQLDAVVEALGRDASRIVVAYEPVWAIGTGRSATPEQAQAVHAFLRGRLGDAGPGVRILYGGSVKADNAAALFALPDIDGGLIGGASLNPASFAAICKAAR